MKRTLGFFIISVCSILAFGQYPANPYGATTEEARIASANKKLQSVDSSRLWGLEAINIGPTVMSGRVVDVAVDPTNAGHFYVAYATGGVWETRNAGVSFVPIFDDNGFTLNIGCLTIDWRRGRIYIGTGESNASRSSYAGFGIFMSPNNGKSWRHLGLAKAHHISKILIDHLDGNTLYAAAIGPLYSPSEERGVFKSRDGGISWQKVLFVDSRTGVIDLIMDSRNPFKLMAAAWEKDRRAWDFTEGGSKSGVYVTTNGGISWEISKDFPSGPHVGRIGLELGKEGTVYALLDNQETYQKEIPEQPGVLRKKQFKTMSKDEFLKLNDAELDAFLKGSRFPSSLNAKKAKKMVSKGDLKPVDLYNYLTDSNAALFEDPVKGAELYKSVDFGGTWEKTHEGILENICYSYGYYFGTLAVGAVDQHVYIAGVPLLASKNGGKTFEFIGGDNVHVDHHYIWVNPGNPNHIINGNDGGINITYDGGKSWLKCNSPAVGQFYTVNVDYKKPYNVYGGLQDNGSWVGPSNYEYSTLWQSEGRYPYQRLMGGDGMKVEIDEKNGYVYTGYQFGHYFRIDQRTNRKLYIHPMQELKEDPYRWNWQTPLVVSKHKPNVVYMGSNKFHMSKNSGESFKTLSGDLTAGRIQGNVSYGTLTCIEESPSKFGMLYVGSDDGKVHFSSNGGKSWKDISKGLPANLWVSRIVASEHQENRVYVTMNGYRWDHFDSYLYVSENNGESWKRLNSDLPLEPVNVLMEDPVNEKMLYVGTDGGVYVSYDMAAKFIPIGGIPPVAVHDLQIQREADDLIIATHGRSLYKLNLMYIREYPKIKNEELWIAKISPVKYRSTWGSLDYEWSTVQHELEITIFKSNFIPFEVIVSDEDGKELLKEVWEGSAGFVQNELVLAFPNEGKNTRKGDDGMYYPLPGKFTLTVKSIGLEKEQTITIRK